MRRVRGGILRFSEATALLGALFLASGPAGCSSTDEPEPKTVKEILEENSTLLVDLASYQSVVRDEAAQRVRQLGREQGTALILHLLTDPTLEDDRVEIVLARILAEWRDPRAVPYLLQFLPHPDRGAQRNAVEGLALFPSDPRVMDALGELVMSEDRREREIAAATLIRLRTPAALDLCARRVRQEPDPKTRANLLIAIVNSDHAQRKRVLVESLDDLDQAIRELAWAGLERYPDLPDEVDYSPSGTPKANDPAVRAKRESNLRILRLWARSGR